MNNLIREVKKHPLIYNRAHPYFKDRKVKEKTWCEISTAINLPPHVLKERWRSLRDRYVHELSKNQRNVIKWKYFQEISFLRDYIQLQQSSFDLNQKQEQMVVYETDDVKKHDLESSSHAMDTESSINIQDEQRLSFNKLIDVFSTVVNKVSDDNSDTDGFYKFLNSILCKVNKNEQDKMKIELINFASNRVKEILDKQNNILQ